MNLRAHSSVSLLIGGMFFLFTFVPSVHAAGFTYNFSVDGTVNESSAPTNSTSPYWWVNSGGMMRLADGVATTNRGALTQTNPWRLAYLSANPVDTDNGYHPQNLFRLVTKDTWESASVVADFYIERDNWSESTNRNSSNGLLLMNRYALDGQTLYYAGIRVDGTAVIKKKYHGTYYTMAQKKIFPGTYTQGAEVNLLPHGEWITLKSDTVTRSNGSVRVDLYMKRAGASTWTLLLSASDDGKTYGSTPAIRDGHAGIRTDFMDVKFDAFRVNPL